MAKRSARRAKSSGTGRRKAAPALAANASDREKAIHALMAQLAEHPWIEIGLSDIAEEAGLSLAQLRDVFGSPLAILGAFIKSVDHAVLEGTDPEMAEEPPRERLFDVLMRRLEILAPHKDAIRSLQYSARRNPPLAFALNAMMVQSQQWMLAAAGIRADGPKGMIRAQGLAVMFAQILSIWVDDEEPGLDRTMAALDRGLSRGQRWSGFLDDLLLIPECFARRRRRHFRRHWHDRGDEEVEAA
jgi:AcrR family transcriptional regulator